MLGRFAKLQLARGVTALCLLLGADCAFAGNPQAAQTDLVRAARAGTAGAALTIAEAGANAAADRGSSCDDQQSRLEAILAKGPEGSGSDELKSFSKTVTCARLGPLVVAAIDRFNASAVGASGPPANSPELVRAAQLELSRLGCFEGKINGSLTTTRDALARYVSSGGGTVATTDITGALLADLAGHAGRVCPMSCASGEIARGDACIIEASRTDPAAPLPPEAPPKIAPERHAAPAEAPREPQARPKNTAAQAHPQPGNHAGNTRPGSVYGVGF